MLSETLSEHGEQPCERAPLVTACWSGLGVRSPVFRAGKRSLGGAAGTAPGVTALGPGDGDTLRSCCCTGTAVPRCAAAACDRGVPHRPTGCHKVLTGE